MLACDARNAVAPELSAKKIRKLNAKPAAWFSISLPLTLVQPTSSVTNYKEPIKACQPLEEDEQGRHSLLLYTRKKPQYQTL